MESKVSAATAKTPDVSYQLSGTPATGLAMGTWGFFIGFAAVALYGPAARSFQQSMHLGGLGSVCWWRRRN